VTTITISRYDTSLVIVNTQPQINVIPNELMSNCAWIKNACIVKLCLFTWQSTLLYMSKLFHTWVRCMQTAKFNYIYVSILNRNLFLLVWYVGDVYFREKPYWISFSPYRPRLIFFFQISNLGHLATSVDWLS